MRPGESAGVPQAIPGNVGEVICSWLWPFLKNGRAADNRAEHFEPANVVFRTVKIVAVQNDEVRKLS